MKLSKSDHLHFYDWRQTQPKTPNENYQHSNTKTLLFQTHGSRCAKMQMNVMFIMYYMLFDSDSERKKNIRILFLKVFLQFFFYFWIHSKKLWIRWFSKRRLNDFNDVFLVSTQKIRPSQWIGQLLFIKKKRFLFVSCGTCYGKQ